MHAKSQSLTLTAKTRQNGFLFSKYPGGVSVRRRGQRPPTTKERAKTRDAGKKHAAQPLNVKTARTGGNI